MPVIDPKGLFEGERLARCSKMARLYWPYFMCASNGFGRLELSYPKIIASAFSTFHEPPSEQEVMGYMRQYADNRLLFIYRFKTQLWGQWDSKSWTFGTHKSKSDERSPAPPEKAFTEWIAENRELSKREQSTEIASIRSIEEIAEELRNSTVKPTEDLRHGNGVGNGVGEYGVGVGEKTSPAAPVILSVKPPDADLQLLKRNPDEEIYGAYPRKEGRRPALEAIAKAKTRLLHRESPDQPEMNRDEIHVYLLQRTRLYAKSPRGRAGPSPPTGPATPHPATWFNQSRYLDDETNWNAGVSNGDRSTSKTGQRNAGNLQALVSGALGDSLRGDDVHHGRPVQPGTVRDAQGPTITVPNGQDVEGKPSRVDPASDA